MKFKVGCIAVLAMLLFCCASVKTPDGGEYKTLGVALVENCEEFEGREDGMVKRCVDVSTDAFSGWEAIMSATSSAFVKIFTFGLL